MKNLHLTNTDKFVLPYIKFINKYYDRNSHYFAVFIDKPEDKFPFQDENIGYFNLKHEMSRLNKLFYKYDHIYLHGLFNIRVVFLLFIQPWLLKKCSWIIWGADLYRYREKKKGFKMMFYEIMRKNVIKKFGRILPLVEGDYYLAKKWYGVTNNYKITKYVNMERNDYINELLNNQTNNNEVINIHVGNSASKNNNHIEAFKMLEKFKGENIRIYCPLSYGDPENAKVVKKIGFEIFGEKFVPLEEFMEIKKYLEHMNKMDIGIFNNDRQQGFGNINELLFLKKKVYLNSGNTLWGYYKEMNIKVYPIDEIKDISFNEFINISDNVRDKNHQLIKHRFSNEYTKEIWDDVFSSVKNIKKSDLR